MQLRSYQTEAIEQVRQAMAAGSTHPLLVMPTGSGKTVVATEIVRRASEKKKRVLFLAPRRELIYQTVQTFQRNKLFCGMLMAGEAMAPSASIQVASFDTLHARAVKGDRIEMPRADLVIVDEAHLSISETRKNIISHYDRVIGLTATPARGDGRGLGEIYDSLNIGTDIRELTEQGHLVPVRYFAPSTPDLEGVKVSGGDYVIKQLGEAVDKPQLVGDVVQNWLRLAPERRTVVFCVNRKHSRHVRNEFLKAGIAAEHLDGETPLGERHAILDRVRSGETQVLCNVFVATYGLDIPPLDCAVLARPTRNIALYLQTIGRVLRTYPGKEDAIVIDHAGAVAQHGFVDDPIPWSLDAESKVSERKEAEERERKELSDMTCPNCGHVARAAKVCSACGWEMLPPSKPVPTKHAELAEIETNTLRNKRHSKAQKRSVFGGLLHYAQDRGFSSGWASHKYREYYGVWPNAYKGTEPSPPSDELRRWIKSRQIAWANRRDVK